MRYVDYERAICAMMSEMARVTLPPIGSPINLPLVAYAKNGKAAWYFDSYHGWTLMWARA